MQEEIKVTGVTVFVNPYTEPDAEEEEEKTKDGKNAEDEENVSFWTLKLRSGTFCSLFFLPFSFQFLSNHMDCCWYISG